MQNINPDLIIVGTKLVYQDAANFQKWTVKEVFDGGFLAVDEHEEKDFWFDLLQNGWRSTVAILSLSTLLTQATSKGAIASYSSLKMTKLLKLH